MKHNINKEINVALLADNLSIGGTGRYCINLVKGLSAYSDLNVRLLALGGRSDKWLTREANILGIDVEVLPMQSFFDLRVVSNLQRILKEHQVHILHSQAYRSNIISHLAVLMGRLPTHLVCTVHGIYQFDKVIIRTKFFYAFDYLTMGLFHQIIAVSAANQRQLARWGIKQKVTLIHNGTILPPYQDERTKMARRRELRISDSARVVSFVGRLSPQKGVEAFVDVARRIMSTTQDVFFIVVGDGALMPIVEACAQEYRSRMLLFGPQFDVKPFYQISDVILIPSPSPMEGLPFVLLEALAHGVPVVASNVGGIPEVVIDGYNGFLCEPTDTYGMSGRTLQILSDCALREELSFHARRTIKEKFSLDSMIEKTHRVYQSLISK